MFFSLMDAATVAIFIPIISVVGGVAIAIVAIIVAGKKKDLEHRERLVAMEKGIALPEPPEEVRKPSHQGRRAAGLVIAGIGIALTLGLYAEDGFRTGVWGLIPLLIGVGLLIASVLDKREYERYMEMRSSGPQTPQSM